MTLFGQDLQLLNTNWTKYSTCKQWKSVYNSCLFTIARSIWKPTLNGKKRINILIWLSSSLKNDCRIKLISSITWTKSGFSILALFYQTWASIKNHHFLSYWWNILKFINVFDFLHYVQNFNMILYCKMEIKVINIQLFFYQKLKLNINSELLKPICIFTI